MAGWRVAASGVEAGRELLGQFPRERRMTQTHAVLWTTILLATVVDVVLTMVGLGLGLGEGNPVVGTMVSMLGLPGLWVVKYLAMVWLVAGWALLSDRNASIFLALFAVVTIAVTAHNTLLIHGAVRLATLDAGATALTVGVVSGLPGRLAIE